MFFNPLKVYLGVRYDRQHTLAEHVQKLCQSVSSRLNLYHAPGGTTWGWHTSDRRQVYIVIVRSMLEYAAASWPPWLSTISTRKLEKVQLETARSITGLVHSTQVEAVLAESQLPPITTRFQTICILTADEWAHLPPADNHHHMQKAPEEERLA